MNPERKIFEYAKLFFHKPLPGLSLAMSLIIPGLGQVYNRQYVKSFIYLCLVSLSIALSLYFFGWAYSLLFFGLYLFLTFHMLSDAYVTAYRRRRDSISDDERQDIYFRIALGMGLVFVIGFWMFSIFCSLELVPYNARFLGFRQNDRILTHRSYYVYYKPRIGDIVRIEEYQLLGIITEIERHKVKIMGAKPQVNRVSAEKTELWLRSKSYSRLEKVILIYAPISRRRLF